MNTSSSPNASSSPLEDPPGTFRDQPFYDETITLLRCVRDHDFATLADLCDDDFGIVDIDPSGSARPIRSRRDWEDWFTTLFRTLQTMKADTDSAIVDYKALRDGSLGYSVLEFRQTLTVGVHVATFDCVATIIWKLTEQGWRESRWHASVISSDIPVQLSAAAA